MIGPDVEVVVTEVTRTSVKLGIVAPKNTAILRGELRDAVEAANREAAETVTDPDALPLPLPENTRGPWVRRE